MTGAHDRGQDQRVERIDANDTSVRHIPRLALSKAEAAEALGVSVDFLEEHVIGGASGR